MNLYTFLQRVPLVLDEIVSTCGESVAPTDEVIQPPASNLPTGQAGVELQTQGLETFTIGVTNLAFNPTNAIFGRLLRTKDGHMVTQAYWYQKETVSHDEIPYYER